MKTENIIFWAAGAGAIILVVYILVEKAKDKAAAEKAAAQAAANANQATTPGSTPSGSGAGSGAPATLNRNKVLKIGDTGEEVKELQRKLNALGATLVIDGQFGNLTETALAQQTAGGYREISLNQFDVLFAPSTPTPGADIYAGNILQTGTGIAAPSYGFLYYFNPANWF